MEPWKQKQKRFLLLYKPLISTIRYNNMGEKKPADWIGQPKNNRILVAFSVPKTPKRVQEELNINKFNLKPFLKRRLIKCLNPETHKGRLYTLTNKSRKLLKISSSIEERDKDYDLIGWIVASPRQRYVVLKTLTTDSVKRTSEEIRKRASSLNPCLSRISTKGILKELINRNLVETEMGDDLKRYYWVNEEGKSLAGHLNQLFTKPIFHHGL